MNIILHGIDAPAVINAVQTIRFSAAETSRLSEAETQLTIKYIRFDLC
ncbi:hypothetical protein H6G80_11795 [Nostoc sp. FACHB-87]|nr:MULTISPECIES: hypothetical protein [Nostocaceae]MBD2454762.1 hypothetical protein [Nostoc sp. FACHB-87]MBD2476781.1 hypothetical protein [Anabaena sp. FACHB-83]